MRQQDAGFRLLMRRMRQGKIDRGIDQHLTGNCGTVAVASGNRHHGGEIAPGAVAADHQPGLIDAERLAVGCDPRRCRDGVLDSGGKFVFGSASVIDGDNDELTFVGELPAHHVMRIEIADDPAAAVKKHQAWREPVGRSECLRRVDAGSNRAVRSGDRERLHRFHFRRLGIGDDAPLQIEFACFRRRHGFIRWAARFLEGLEYGCGIGVERYGHEGKTSDIETVTEVTIMVRVALEGSGISDR